MINSVNIIKEDGRFIINDDVVVYDLKEGKDGITYAVYYNEKKTEKDYAMKLADEFMSTTMKGILEKE